MASGALILGGLALLFVATNKKKKPAPGDHGHPHPPGGVVPPGALAAAMNACIEQAAVQVGVRIEWVSDEERAGWADQLAAAGFVKAAQCLRLEGEDLAACAPMLEAAIAADLRSLATPLSSPQQFATLATQLEDAGFPEAAACFRA